MHNKVYVLDTTVLIDAPSIIYDLKGLIAVPITVIRQLDGLKKSENTDVALKARRASRMLDEITARGDPVTGITMPNGSIFKLARKYTPIDTLDNISDNKIVGTAEALKKEAANDGDVTVLTTDVNMRIAARERGVKAPNNFGKERREEVRGKIIVVLLVAMIAGIGLFFLHINDTISYISAGVVAGCFFMMPFLRHSTSKKEDQTVRDSDNNIDIIDPIEFSGGRDTIPFTETSISSVSADIRQSDSFLTN